MANRYSDYSVSAYKPRTTQELMAFPLMKRKLHDDANEKLQTYLGELNKINPLDKHYNESQQIKSNLTKQIDEQSQTLAREGFNNNTTSNIFKTNREIQDMYSPTGKVGQINAAKIGYDKDSAEYLKSATALGHSPEVVQKNLTDIQNKYNQSPIYDNKGKVIPFAINQLPPKYVDHISRAREFFKDAGITATQIDNLASRLITKPDGSGYVLSQGAKSGDSSNEKQLQSAVNFLNSEINNPNSEVGKSLKYGYKSPQEAIEDIKNMSPIYKKNSRERANSSQISNLFDAPKSKTDEIKNPAEGVTGTPIDSIEVGAKPEEIDDINKIGKSRGKNGAVTQAISLGTSARLGTDYEPKPNGIFKYTDLSPLMSKRYESTYNKLKRTGQINSQVSINNSDVAKKIQGILKQEGPITLSSSVITDDNVLNNLGFPGAIIGKDSKAKTSSIIRDLQYGTRKFIDPKDGKSKTWNEMAEAGYKPETTSYYGYMSPHSWKDTKFGAKSQNVSQHQITLKDEDGKVYSTEISRTKNDGNANDIQASNDLKKTYQNATISPNDFVDFKSTNPKLKNVKVAYVTKNDQGEILPQPVFIVKKGDQQQVMSEADYMATVYKLYKQ